MEPDNFSISSGGPIYNRMHWFELSRPGKKGVFIRAAITALLAWLPLLIISVIEGLAWGNSVKVPFLKDYAAYTRFLVAVPLFIIAEIIIDNRLSAVVGYFTSTGLVKDEDKPAYQSIVSTMQRLRDLTSIEILILAIIYISLSLGINQELPKSISTWRITSAAGTPQLSVAGFWYTLISIPIFQFLIYRWIWRIIVWDYFLWRVSKFKLDLTPTHPDLAGGLGILNIAQASFFILIFAASAAMAGLFAARIIYLGVPISRLEAPAFVFIVLIVMVFLAPLTAFAPILIITKIKGQLEYGAFASEYTQSFQSKWIRNRQAECEPPLGTSDIQSLADLANSYAIVGKMHIVPFDIPTTMLLAASAIIPMLPLLFIAKPVIDTITTLAKLVMKLLG